MKRYSPFLLLLITIYFSCSDRNKPVAENKAAELLSKSYDTTLSPVQKMKLLSEATKIVSKTNNDSLKFDLAANKYSVVAAAFPDSTSLYLIKLENAIGKNSGQSRKAYLASTQADYYLAEKQYIAAFGKYYEANELYGKNDSLRSAYALIQIAEIMQLYSDYEASKQVANDAIKRLKNSGFPQYVSKAYSILGTAYLNTIDYDDAITNYKNSRQFATNDAAKFTADNNIACTFIAKGDYDKAIAALQKLLKLPLYNTLKSKALHNLGYALFKKTGKDGLAEMEQSLAICQLNNALEDFPSGYLHLAEYYKSYDPKRALALARKSYKAAADINSTDEKLEAIRLLMQLGESDEKSIFTEKYIHLGDSINSIRRTAKNDFADKQYNYEEEQRKRIFSDEKAMLETENRNIAIISGATLVIFIIIFFYYFSKKQKELADYKTETRIAKRIHDELANDVFYTMSFAEKENLSEAENKQTLLHNLDNIYYRTRDISRDLGVIDTGPEYPQQFRELMSGYHSSTVKIIVIGMDAVPWEQLTDPKKIVLQRIVQEWLTNMKRHSHATTVVMSFKINKKKLVLDYSDDGVGLAAETSAAKKILTDTGYRIAVVNGKYTFTPSDKGLKVSLSIPL